MSAFFVGARITGMITVLPIFGSRNYPLVAKVGLILFLTVLVAPIAKISFAVPVDLGLSFAFLIINELIFGLFLGFLVTVYLGFIYFAGDIIDYLIGFSMVSVMNPLDETQMPITSNLLYVYLTLVFLSLDLHHRLIITLAESFSKVEVGALIKGTESLSYLMKVVSEMLLIGFSLAAPFVITILVADIVLGLLSKAMPGMNIFILGMPFKILIGVTLFLLVVPMLYELFGAYISEGVDWINRYLDGVAS